MLFDCNTYFFCVHKECSLWSVAVTLISNVRRSPFLYPLLYVCIVFCVQLCSYLFCKTCYEACVSCTVLLE